MSYSFYQPCWLLKEWDVGFLIVLSRRELPCLPLSDCVHFHLVICRLRKERNKVKDDDQRQRFISIGIKDGAGFLAMYELHII